MGNFRNIHCIAVENVNPLFGLIYRTPPNLCLIFCKSKIYNILTRCLIVSGVLSCLYIFFN